MPTPGCPPHHRSGSSLPSLLDEDSRVHTRARTGLHSSHVCTLTGTSGVHAGLSALASPLLDRSPASSPHPGLLFRPQHFPASHSRDRVRGDTPAICPPLSPTPSPCPVRSSSSARSCFCVFRV